MNHTNRIEDNLLNVAELLKKFLIENNHHDYAKINKVGIDYISDVISKVVDTDEGDLFKLIAGYLKKENLSNGIFFDNPKHFKYYVEKFGNNIFDDIMFLCNNEDVLNYVFDEKILADDQLVLLAIKNNSQNLLRKVLENGPNLDSLDLESEMSYIAFSFLMDMNILDLLIEYDYKFVQLFFDLFMNSVDKLEYLVKYNPIINIEKLKAMINRKYDFDTSHNIPYIYQILRFLNEHYPDILINNLLDEDTTRNINRRYEEILYIKDGFSI